MAKQYDMMQTEKETTTKYKNENNSDIKETVEASYLACFRFKNINFELGLKLTLTRRKMRLDLPLGG